jgi:hypothetical protein
LPEPPRFLTFFFDFSGTPQRFFPAPENSSKRLKNISKKDRKIFQNLRKNYLKVGRLSEHFKGTNRITGECFADNSDTLRRNKKMSSYTTKTGQERLERIENSWETNAPGEEKFGEVPIAEIKAERMASEAKKDEISLAEEKLKRLRIEYKDMITASMKKCDFVVRSVEGDRRFGPDSALYAGFGYIRDSEKKRGGKRRPKIENK